jgi:DNA-binding response OmpR family regulator
MMSRPSTIPTGTATILLVEDDPLVRTIVSATLVDCGYQVLDAAYPQDALQLDDDQIATVDLLIADVVLPRMNGRQLYERLQRHCPALQVLYISGYDREVARVHGVEAAAANFLPKPFSALALAQKVHTLLTAPSQEPAES